MVQMTVKNPSGAVPPKPAHDENYWFMVLLYFASFLVGLGIIAMIAANWQEIPDNVKLLGALVSMALNAGVLGWTVKHDKNVLKQVVACVFAFLIMAVIGLIGQIYHLPSNIENALLLWGLCSWPLFLVVPRLLWLWIPLFYGGARYLNVDLFDNVSLFTSDSLLLDHNFGAQKYGITINLLRILSCLGLFVAYEIWQIKGDTKNKTIQRPLFLYSGLMMYLLFVNMVRIARTIAYSVNINPEVTPNLALSLGGTHILPCLLVGAGIYLWNKKHDRVSFMPIFLGATLLEFAWVYIITRTGINDSSLYKNVFSNFSYELISPIIFCWIVTRWTIYHKAENMYQCLAYISLILWFFVVFGENLHYVIPSLALCAFAAWLSYRANSRRWFNVAIIAAVLRILIYYADVSDLMHAGIYLTGSGVLIISVILALMKYGHLLWEKKDEK